MSTKLLFTIYNNKTYNNISKQKTQALDARSTKRKEELKKEVGCKLKRGVRNAYQLSCTAKPCIIELRASEASSGQIKEGWLSAGARFVSLHHCTAALLLLLRLLHSTSTSSSSIGPMTCLCMEGMSVLAALRGGGVGSSLQAVIVAGSGARPAFFFSYSPIYIQCDPRRLIWPPIAITERETGPKSSFAFSMRHSPRRQFALLNFMHAFRGHIQGQESDRYK